MVREYVATRRRAIRIEAGREPAATFIPQEHLPGREAEVDFREVVIRLRGELVTCALFCLRLSYSGKATHRISASAGQEAFMEGHVHAFRTLGGVPVGKIRYDNLQAAVASVLGFSRQRAETYRWTAFGSHYGIEAFYWQPGITGAHEKGGAEGQIGPSCARIEAVLLPVFVSSSQMECCGSPFKLGRASSVATPLRGCGPFRFRTCRAPR
jgi:hypothetical protein